VKQTAELESGSMSESSEDQKQVAISVIVPVSERPETLRDLYREYSEPLRKAGWDFEFIVVAEPWYRQLTVPLTELAAEGEPIRILEVGQTVGEAALLRLAAAHCRGPVVITLPSYRRVLPAALPLLITRVMEGADVAVARRWPRRDSWFNRLQSWAFHLLILRFSRNRIHDVACGVRAMRRDVLQEIPLYGDFFRFLPLLALREGYRVVEVDSTQHPADAVTRVYSPGIYLRRLIDVLGLFFLLRFTEKPLRFFGLVGAVLSLVGGLILFVLFIQRLAGQGIAGRPLLLLGVLLAVLGVQAIALGLIGEIIVHLHAPGRRSYRLARSSPENEGSE
jgi:hypothetical protein